MSFAITKKALLTGTALVAAAFCVTTAQAAPITVSTTFSSPVTGNAGSGASGDDAVISGANSITLTNDTTITGGAGDASFQGGAGILIDSQNSNTVRNNSGATIVGGDGGDGADGSGSAGDLGGDGGFGVLISGTSATAVINNAGTISGGAAGAGGAGDTGENGGDGGYGGIGVILGSIGTTFNNLEGGIVNAGAGGAAGAAGSGGVAGTAGEDGAAVYVGSATATITNAGTINGLTGSGIDLDSGATGAIINNTGAINVTGNGTGVTIRSGATGARLNNSGTISATDGAGVGIYSGGTGFVLNNTGTISATNGSALGVGEAFTIQNLGTLTSSGTSATLNIGPEQTASADVVLNGTVINTNTTTGGAAVAFGAAQTTNKIINTGTIIADGSATAGAGLGNAINLSGGANFENRGTMRGTVTGGGASNVFTQTAGSLKGNITYSSGANTLNINGGTVAGNISLSGGSNTATFAGGTTTGNVSLTGGSNSVTVTGGTLTGDIALSGGSGSLTFSGGSVIGNVTGTSNTDNLIFNGGSVVGTINLGLGPNTTAVNQDYTTAGAINGAGTNAVTVAAGKTFTVNHVLQNVAGLNVGAGSIVKINETNTAAGSGVLVNAGTVEIASGKTLNTFGYTPGTGTFNFKINQDGNDLTPGVLDVAGALDLTNASVVFSIDPTMSVANLPTGAAVFASGSSVVAPTAWTDTSLLYDFDVNAAGNDLTVEATRVAGGLEGIVTSGNNAAVAASLDGNTGSANTQIASLQSRMAASNSATELNDLVESVSPTVDSSASVAAVNVANQSLSVTNSRLAGMRAARSGVNTGDASVEERVWLQPFAVTVDQDARDGVDGYDADTYGATVGFDTDGLVRDMIIGVAFTYANTDANSKNINLTNSDIDSYQVNLYGDYNLGSRAFIDGSVGYGWNSIDRTRSNVGGVPGTTANADYDSEQFVAAVGVGQTLQPFSRGFELTPRAGVRYTHLSTDNFTETGAGGLNLASSTADADALELGVAAELAYNVATQDGLVTPALHVGYTYDAIGDDVQTTSAFTGGGAAFTTQGADPAQSTLNAGAGVTYYSNDNVDLSINYDAQLKSGYTAHAGYLKVLTKF